MSAEESATAVVAAPVNATQPIPQDLASILQQIQAIQAQQHLPVLATPSAPNPLVGLEALLGASSLANLATAGTLNPLSMLALTSTLNQANPVYQGIARVLLTMNMGQLLATQQTSELLATMNQQETLAALLAARGNLPFPLPGQNHQQQSLQEGFAVPQVFPQMSLKRANKDLATGGASDRKKPCPPLGLAAAQQVLPPQPPRQTETLEVAPRSPSPPPRKSMFENLPPEMKEKNEMFRKEILRRLDIILLEELGAEDEEDEKKVELKPSPTSEEDDGEDSKTESMGAAGSAFRRILSRSSTIGNNSGSPSASGTTSPSTGSLSSGPDSPPLEGDSLSAEFLEMLRTVALKHKEQGSCDSLFAKVVDKSSFSQHFPMVWTGRLSLKSTDAMINLHLINGSETFLNDVLGRQLTEENPRRDSVKISQRLRLDNGQVEHIHRILTNPEYACCLALSSVNDFENLAQNETNLKASIIDYLTSKQIAGISSLDEVDTKFKSARVHVFAPGEIVNKYLSELASPLHEYLQNTETRYLLIVFTNDKSEPNMASPPSAASLAVPLNSS